MRILLVSPGFPVPREAGSPRTFQLARQLAARHAIDLLVVTQGAAAEPAMLARYRGPESPFRDVSGRPGRAGCANHPAPAGKCASGRPLVRHPAPPAGGTRSRDRAVTAAARDVDMIWVDSLPMVQYAAGTGLPLVVDERDHLSRMVDGHGTTGSYGSGYLLGRWRASLVRRYERRTLRRAAAVVLNSPVEATLLARDLGVSVDVVRNGCDTNYFAPSAVDHRLDGAPSLLFVGNLEYGPNHDAARFIINELAPAITDRFPDARFHVVGTPADIAVPAGSPVEVVGFVDDIRQWYAGADVFISPLRYGGGIKNRSWKRCHGVRHRRLGRGGGGNRPARRRALPEAATPQEYVERLSALVADADRRAAMSAAARAAAVANFSWANAGASFEAILDRAARRGR